MSFSRRIGLRQLALRALAARTAFSRPAQAPISALICPSAPPGSVGDEAMIIALRDSLRDRGVSRIGIMTYRNARSWAERLAFDYAVDMPERAVHRWSDFARSLQETSHFFVIGADCIDGYYSIPLSRRLIELAGFAAHCGCTATICGSSFNAGAAPEVVAAIRDLPAPVRILARDPVSQGRLQGFGCTSADLVADLAFLLRPEATLIPKSAAWITRQRGAGRRILGINVANAALGSARKDETPELVERFAEAINTTLAADAALAIVLLPHDVRGERSDRALCTQVHQKIHPSHGDRVLLFSESFDPRALKAVAGRLDACVTCRMHLAIACLGSGTPVGVVPYQDKFEGLFQHFEISPALLSPESFLAPGGVETLIRGTLDSAEDQAATIRYNKERVLDLAGRNLGDLPSGGAPHPTPIVSSTGA